MKKDATTTEILQNQILKANDFCNRTYKSKKEVP